MNDAPNLTHHNLTAECVTDEHGKAIMLTQQDGLAEPSTVLVHPWQLRAVCEQFEIIASDPQAAKTIATLQRRMVALRDRIDSLADWMALYSDHKHADLSYETTRLNAMADIACEWCADFEDEHEVSDSANSAPAQAATAARGRQVAPPPRAAAEPNPAPKKPSAIQPALI